MENGLGRLVALAAILTSAIGNAAQTSVQVCNRMTVDLVNVTFSGGAIISLPTLLHPGECATVPGVVAGPYTLEFIERVGAQAAMCRRVLNVSEAEVITIAPDDGSNCMM